MLAHLSRAMEECDFCEALPSRLCRPFDLPGPASVALRGAFQAKIRRRATLAFFAQIIASAPCSDKRRERSPGRFALRAAALRRANCSISAPERQPFALGCLPHRDIDADSGESAEGRLFSIAQLLLDRSTAFLMIRFGCA